MTSPDDPHLIPPSQNFVSDVATIALVGLLHDMWLWFGKVMESPSPLIGKEPMGEFDRLWWNQSQGAKNSLKEKDARNETQEFSFLIGFLFSFLLISFFLSFFFFLERASMMAPIVLPVSREMGNPLFRLSST